MATTLYSTEYELSRITARNDAGRVLKCKNGFKQQGAVCKPIKKVVGEDKNGAVTVNAENRPLSRSGSSLAFSAMQRSPQVYGDLKRASGTVKIEHLEKIPVGDLASKEIRAKAEKQFKPGDMVRKGFDPTGRGDYAHHYGIYAGKGRIIEVDGDSSGGYSIKESPLYKREVVPTTEYEKVPDIPKKKDTPEARKKALALGKSMVGTPFAYDLAESNCESFARAIYYGNPETKQGKALGDFTGQIVKETMFQNQKNREGLTAQEINNLFKKKGYDPKVASVIFKPLIAQRNQQNAASNRAASKLARGDAGDNLAGLAQEAPNNPWKTLRDPEDMEKAIAEVSSGYNGAAKQLITMEVYKLYLLAFFAMMSPKGKDSDREDAVKKIKCKPGYKQQGAVCKPVKDTEPDSTKSKSLSTLATVAIIPSALAAGIILGGLGASASIIAADAKTVVATDISHLEIAPTLKDINKEEIAAEYDKKFKKGDLIRRAFPLVYDKNKYAYHYAIYAGNGEVIHTNPDKADGVSILKQFAHGSYENEAGSTKYELVDTPPSNGKSPIRSREHTLELAESMVGLPFKWNAVESNCESFARTVAYGSAKSSQTEKISGFGIKAVTSLIDIVDAVKFGGVINRGLHSDEIKKTLEKNNYNPALIKSIFKAKKDERAKEIALKNKRSDAYQEDSAELVDPRDFTRLVKNTSANFNGVAKQILEEKMFKTYLIALFASVSKPSAKDSKQDSFTDSVSDQQRMMRSVISIITKSFGTISSISRVSRNFKGLITVYFHPLSNPARLIKFEIGNTVKYGEFNIGNAANYQELTNQRIDSLISETQSNYVKGLLSVQVRLDKIGTKQKKCVKGIPCKGECIPRTSTCEVDIEQVADPQTIRNLYPSTPNPEPISATMPQGDEDIYALMSIRDLRQEVRKREISNYSYMSQDQLRAAIKLHDADPQYKENVRKSLQKQKDLSTLKIVKSTEIGRAIGAVNPALGRQFNLLSAIGRKYEKNPTEALIYAIPALIGTTKVAMVLLQKQRLANIKESAGAAVNDAEKYRKDIEEDDASAEGVNFYVGGYGAGSKDLYNKVSNSKLANEKDIDWIKNKTDNFTIDREGEHIPSAHNASQDLGNNITTGYNVVVNNTFKRGKNREAVELAAKMYAHGTTWRRDKNGVLSMPPIQILAAEDGGTLARDAIEILHQMPRDPSTKITGKHIADRVKLVTLGTPYFGESKADIPEVNLVGDGDPWASLPFNRGSQTKRVTGVGGANQNAYVSSADGINAIFNNLRSGIDTRGIVDEKSAGKAESARKKSEPKQSTAKQAEEAANKVVRDKEKREREAELDKLIRDELKKQANSIEELDRLSKDTAVYAKTSKIVKERLKLERETAGFAKRTRVT
jgi:cell wall-associated NlpC family hydrolase